MAGCAADSAPPSYQGTPPAAVSCLDGITDYFDPGPFTYDMQAAGMVKFWVPAVPAGCKVPVIHLANGTTGTCGNYQPALQRLASHGFLAACYEDPNTGAGAFGLTAFDTALEKFPDLADRKLGSTGHSQGGQAALITQQLAEAKFGDTATYAALAMEPASGYGVQPQGQTWQEAYAKIRSPVFMFSGNAGAGYVDSTLSSMDEGDGIVSIRWVQQAFDTLSDDVEAYHWTAVGAAHVPPPVVQEERISIPWFRWKLLGDKTACEFFKTKPRESQWLIQSEQNAEPCD